MDCKTVSHSIFQMLKRPKQKQFKINKRALLHYCTNAFGNDFIQYFVVAVAIYYCCCCIKHQRNSEMEHNLSSLKFQFIKVNNNLMTIMMIGKKKTENDPYIIFHPFHWTHCTHNNNRKSFEEGQASYTMRKFHAKL